LDTLSGSTGPVDALSFCHLAHFEHWIGWCIEDVRLVRHALLQCLGLRESKKRKHFTEVVKLTSFTHEVKVQGKTQGAKRKGIMEMKCLVRALGHKPNLM
jgi:hypothetical protein